eukprot:scaffold8390_cov90-Isochrysis_galbana.AAC.1
MSVPRCSQACRTEISASARCPLHADSRPIQSLVEARTSHSWDFCLFIYYLPETGRGALVIKRIPPGPPAMAKLAPKKEWALDQKLISTVVKFSKFS